MWITETNGIKMEASSFFENKFKEEWPRRPKFCNHGFKKLSECDASFLEGEFTTIEIKNAVWSCGGDKSSGPEGFTFKFIKKILGDAGR